MKKLGVMLVVLVVLAAGFYMFYSVRNPEKREMNDAARAGVPGKFVRLADGVTHYDIAGPDSGARVMLVHGFSVPYYIWDSTSAALAAAGFRVARYDQFGRGYSDRPAVRYTARLYDRQLLQLLDTLGWTGKVHLVGLSMGGPLVAEFAGQHPERVMSLTLVDPAAGPSGSPPRMFTLPVIGRMLWQSLAVPRMADGQSSDFVEPGRWPDWADRYRPQTTFKGFGRALLSTQVEAKRMNREKVFADAGKTGVPTMLIWGKEDQTVPIRLADDVIKAIPQVQFHAIDHAGHLPHMEQGAVVNPKLIGFLRSAGPNGAVADTAKAAARK
ncbi:MAG: alpha/beta hydrolase [Gemmatimonadaceae bacterium]